MMFGHVETIEDRVQHLQRLRDQQDASGGVYRVHLLDVSAATHGLESRSTDRCRRIPAYAGTGRIFLDNIPNIQSSLSHARSRRSARSLLKYGANDFGP